MIRILSILIVCLLALSGCAFKQSEEVSGKTERNTDSAAGRILIDWSKTPTERLSENLKAIRSLRPSDSIVFEATDPVTLPAELPAVVMVAAEVPESVLSADALFVRSRVIVDGKAMDLLGELGEVMRLSGAAPRVTFVLSGWSAVFPKDQAAQGDVDVDLYSHQNRLMSLRLRFRTPPNHIESKIVSIKDWKTQASATNLPLLSPEVAKKRLNLLSVIQISNSEKIPVSLDFPRRPGAKFSQKAVDFNYRDIGCDGSGFAIDRAESTESLADDILLLPLDSRFLSEAMNGVAHPELRDSITLRLGAGESQDLGIYGMGSSANRWMDKGPNLSTVQQRVVPSDCYKECESVSCHGHGEQRVKSFDVGIMGCSCDSWRSLRHSTIVTVGTSRENPTLNIPSPAIKWPARYGDLDPSRDGEVRDLSLVPTDSQVSWIQ